MEMTTEIDYEKCLKQREAADMYIQLVDKLLQMHTGQALLQFVQLYMEEDFVKNYMASRSELLSGRVLAMITCDELVLDRSEFYAQQFANLEQFIFMWDELRFRLWEMEFFGDEASRERFMILIAENGVSDITLKYLLYTSAVNKKECLLQIADYVLTNGDVKMALLLLQHGCELCPEDQEIPQLLEELQMAIGG